MADPIEPLSAALADRYRIERELGHGGMARVFLALAQGPRGFNKLIVIKQMREEIMLASDLPMTAAEVKNRILEKWPEKNTPTLYNQVFIALGRSELFKKIKKGKFAVREGARKAFEEKKKSEASSACAPMSELKA